MEQETFLRRLSSSGGLLVTAFTGLSFFVAYCYERAYSQTFGFPPELIELRWATVIGSAGTVVLAGLAMLVFAYAADQVSIRGREKLSTRQAAAMDTAIAGVASFVLPLIFGLNWAVSLILAVATVLFWIVATTFGLRRADKRIGTAFSIYDWRLVVAAAILSIAFVVIHTRFNLNRQKEFFVLSGPSPEVVARIYGDKMITIRLDPVNRVLLPVYRILPVAQTPHLAKVRLGRITPVCFRAPRGPLSSAQKLSHRWLDDTPTEYADLVERCRTASADLRGGPVTDQ
jgi:hypothetical protein